MTQICEPCRLLPLTGGQNFRDLGGYCTADGRKVRWRQLLRSGSMQSLTEQDHAYLRAIGLRTVVDFRSKTERLHEPVSWPPESAPRILADDYSMIENPITIAFRAPDPGADDMARAMMAAYSTLPFDLAGQYRAMFKALLAGEAPLAFNCTAGKDRTGIAAALLLCALDVPRAAVIEDYLLSQQHFRMEIYEANAPQAAARMRQKRPEAVRALMGVDRRYIEAMFTAIESDTGNIHGYFERHMELDIGSIGLLRSLYLEDEN